MTGKKYKQLRRIVNKDNRLLERKNKYTSLKIDLMECLIKFNNSDDLFDLVELIKTGNKILKLEGFPIKEYEKK